MNSNKPPNYEYQSLGKDEFMWTLDGKRIYFERPRPQDFEIKTIATCLARICRFGGHTRFHYSVAQHSIYVSENCPKSLQLHGLLHDASEAFLHDLLRPLKHLPKVYEAYHPLEEKFMSAIAKRFGFPYNETTKRAIKEIEKPIELAEIKQLITLPPEDTNRDLSKAANIYIHYTNELNTIDWFLNCYDYLKTSNTSTSYR